MEQRVRLYTEVRKRIGVVHVTVIVDKRDAARIQTQVYPHAVEVQFPDEDKTYKFTFPDDITLNPKSCQGLQWVSGEGIHMRLQLSTEGSRHTDEGWMLMESSTSVEMEMQALRQGDSVGFKCSSCGGSVLQSDRFFSRVLPLPSENWRETSSDWCCHGNEYTASLAESSLTPKESDCFLSELYLSINPSIIDQDAVILKEITSAKQATSKSKPSKKSQVLCCRCRHVLGEVSFKGDQKQWPDTKYCHLYKHSICVSTANKLDKLPVDKHNIFRNYNLEMFLANHFVSLSKSQPTFKFIVESSVDRQPVLLVWLLSSDTTLLCSGSTRGASWEPFYGDDHQASGTSDPADDAVQCYKIAKILYLHHKEEQFQSTHQHWNKDFGVETVQLPNHTCMELLLLLATSTQNTPASLRAMNGFTDELLEDLKVVIYIEGK